MIGGYIVSMLVTLATGVQVPDSTPFPDTKANHWVYAALSRQRLDRFSSWPPNDRPTIRGDVVDAIIKACGQLTVVGTTPTEAVVDLNDWIQEMGTEQSRDPRRVSGGFDAIANVLTQISLNQGKHEEIADLQHLLRAFSIELAARSLDSQEMVKGLSIAEKGLVLDRKNAKDLVRLNSIYVETKKQHWAYEARTRLKTDGLLFESSQIMFGPRNLTHAQFVLDIRTVYMKFTFLIDNESSQFAKASARIKTLKETRRLDESVRTSLKAEYAELFDEIDGTRSYKEDVTDLTRLIKEFAPDMSTLGLDPNDLRRNLGSIGKRVEAMTASAGKIKDALK